MSLLCVGSADSPQPTPSTLLRTTESRPQPHGSFILAIVRTSSPPFVRSNGPPRLCRLAQPFCRRYRRRVLQSRLRLLRDSRLGRVFLISRSVGGPGGQRRRAGGRKQKQENRGGPGGARALSAARPSHQGVQGRGLGGINSGHIGGKPADTLGVRVRSNCTLSKTKGQPPQAQPAPKPTPAPLRRAFSGLGAVFRKCFCF